MRISTQMLYDMGASRISDMQGLLVRTQQQISTGKRILTPADDPIGSARVLELSQSQSINEQYGVNRQNAKHLLLQQEDALANVTKTVQDVQTLLVQAGNPALGDEERKYIAIELQSHFDQLLSLSNSKDGTGNYMFGGYNVKAAPFTATADGASYQGDQGQRMLQIGTTRQISLSVAGSDIFERVRTGNGTFATAAAATNSGTGIVSTGSVVDSGALTNHQYEIVFNVNGDVITYDVMDTTIGPPALSTGNAFVEGQSISFDGIQFDITGKPADGDTFTVQPSRNESVFSTMKDLIATLNQPLDSDGARANLQNGLNKAMNEMGSMLDNVLAVRASVGTRLQEVERLDEIGMDREVFYEDALSDLQDLDYVKALSDLARQQIMLEAAQKTFVTVSGLSLFKMM